MARGAGTNRRRFAFRTRLAAKPMAAAESEAAERLLARLVARAYAADHRELFDPTGITGENRRSSGPPAAAMAVAGVPPASAGGPEKGNREHVGRETEAQR